jgi:hypothetical protein
VSAQEKFDRWARRHPHRHATFSQRPHWTRRQFFRIAGAGVTGAYMAGRSRAAEIIAQPVTTRNQARSVIFILLPGGPSHVDLFDFKQFNGVTPASFKPGAVSGLMWPAGLLPNLSAHVSKLAIVRSMRAWALAHPLALEWLQIGRNPASPLSGLAPNIGSIVAMEKDAERRPEQVFPAFLALNTAYDTGYAVAAGSLPATFAPFRLSPSADGLPNLQPDKAAQMEARWRQLDALDAPLRDGSPLGSPAGDYADYDGLARNLVRNPQAAAAFQFDIADSLRYGFTSFGDACLVAYQALRADQGTRFIQITLDGWDMHSDIYAINNLIALSRTLDQGVAALLADLASSGLLQETLVVMAGEFGRTPGPLSTARGRDHFQQQFCVFAGAGVKGGRAIGETNTDGSMTVDPGWSRERDIRPEDIEATIYSALGINWTTIRKEDGQSFEYVPFSGDDIYGPIDELWMQ